MNKETLVKNLCGQCKSPCKEGYCALFTRALDAISIKEAMKKNGR